MPKTILTLKIPGRLGTWPGRLGICLALAALAAPLPAETFTVTKMTDDDGPCTVDDCALREAVLSANATPGMDVIALAAGIYQLSIPGRLEDLSMTGDLDILDDLEIRGAGPSETRVVGGGDRIFHIGGTVLLSGMTITGGSAGGFGGGVRVTGGDVTISDCDISGNTTLGDGGGIFLSNGNITVIDSTLRNNTARDYGGAIRRSGIGALLPGNMTLINTTISGNTARGGGAIASWFDGKLVIRNSTIAYNRGTSFADHIFFFESSPAELTNVILVGRGCAFASAGDPISNGGNLESPGNSCFAPVAGDQVNVPDAGLAPLGFYGGSTLTHALLPGSPALDSAVESDCESTDQRGLARPADGDGDGTPACDVGAFERQPGDIAALDVPALGRGAQAVLVLVLAALGAVRLRRRPAPEA